MKYSSSFFVFFLIVSACETIVDIDIPSGPPSIVVNCTLADDEFIAVILSESQHILDIGDDVRTISGATVEIYENGSLLTILKDYVDGTYKSENYMPKSGKSYQIKVNKLGFETATSEVLMPLDTAVILDVQVDSVQINDFGSILNYVRFNLDFKDDGRIKNYYEITMLNEYYEYQYDWSTSPPVVVDSSYRTDLVYLEFTNPILEEFQTYGQNVVFNDELFNGKKYSMSFLFNHNQYWQNDELIAYSPFKFTVQMNNTSKSYYQYELSSQLQQWTTGDPFAQPVTVYNNIENGFGIFGAYNTAVFKVE